jgi:hypothetical protein
LATSAIRSTTAEDLQQHIGALLLDRTSHTLEGRVLGTKNARSTGTRVDVNAQLGKCPQVCP